MSVAIIDALEIVHIHEHDRQNPPMACGLRDTVFQPILEQHAVRQPGQRVMQGGIARTLLLFHCRGQLMIDHGPIPDLNQQRLIHRRQPLGCIQQLVHNGRAFLESYCHSRRRVAVRKFARDIRGDRGQLCGGLRYELMDVLALPKHFAEEFTRHACRIGLSGSFGPPYFTV